MSMCLTAGGDARAQRSLVPQAVDLCVEAAVEGMMSEETLLRPGDSCDQGLPIRKNKGKVDKTREDGVEVYSACSYTYIPIPAWKR